MHRKEYPSIKEILTWLSSLGRVNISWTPPFLKNRCFYRLEFLLYIELDRDTDVSIIQVIRWARFDWNAMQIKFHDVARSGSRHCSEIQSIYTVWSVYNSSALYWSSMCAPEARKIGTGFQGSHFRDIRTPRRSSVGQFNGTSGVGCGFAG